MFIFYIIVSIIFCFFYVIASVIDYKILSIKEDRLEKYIIIFSYVSAGIFIIIFWPILLPMTLLSWMFHDNKKPDHYYL